MTEKYEVRQLVKSVKNRELVCVYDSPSERVARHSFESLAKDHPAEYFELVRVIHDEDCLAFTPIKD